MSRLIIVPYKMGSSSARALKDAVNAVGNRRAIRVKPNWSRRAYGSDLLLNWGSTQIPNVPGMRVLNRPEAVAIAQNKLDFFQHMPDELVPEYTTDRQVAQRWVDDGLTVVCRTLLRASCGRGIVLVGPDDPNELPHNCPLFVKYVKKLDEYRIHIQRRTDGTYYSFDAQQKRRRAGEEGVDAKVRNADNGWVFCRENLTIPDAVYTSAARAVQECGLDFGAVDVIFNRHYSRAYVLEINTAPGLEGTTLERYTNMVGEY